MSKWSIHRSTDPSYSDRNWLDQSIPDEKDEYDRIVDILDGKKRLPAIENQKIVSNITKNKYNIQRDSIKRAKVPSGWVEKLK